MKSSFAYKPRNHKQSYMRGRGVLLVNLGTPGGTDYWSMRRYLKEFLSDPRVIEVPRLLWWLILNLIILTFRPTKSGHAYEKIWDKRRNASPLRVITEAQAHNLQKRMGKQSLVRWAMRYGNPSISQVMKEMQDAGVQDILVVPLYPQYAGATYGSVQDAVADYVKSTRWTPVVNWVAPYYDAGGYVDAVRMGIGRQVDAQGWAPDCIVASFHGLPLRYCLKGDPYYCHSHKTARLVAEAMGSAFCRTVDDALKVKTGKKTPAPLLLTFQSRFGREEWLQPYTVEALEALAKAGKTKVVVVCPGFAADCVETLEEIAMGARESFMAAGGTHFAMVPCLNDSMEGMDMLEHLVKENL